MQLSETAQIRHPYVLSISDEGDIWAVELRRSFPTKIRKFSLVLVPEIWEGVIEIEGTIGFLEGDRISWLHGSGYNRKEALVSALSYFVNWVVDPGMIDSKDFIVRDLSEIPRGGNGEG